MSHLADFTYDGLEKIITDLGEKSYRTKQVYQWLYRGIASFDEMTDVSKALREKLAGKFTVGLPEIAEKLVSKLDGTVKYLFRLSDGNFIESVVMQYHHGTSICVSSQVGCRMGCGFCASTLGGLVRNLAPSEISGQILAAQKDLNLRISNVVLMGIGEPLDNFENVLIFLKNANHKDGLGISYRGITLSTCGLADKILRLAKEKLPITLAVSLHAPNDEIRKKTMPVARRFSMDELLSAVRAYVDETGRRVTFEYALIKGVNDAPAQAEELADRLTGILCHVNLILVNPVAERSFSRGSQKDARRFMAVLEGRRVPVSMRRELGSDINASCGQLRNKHQNDLT